MKLASAIVAASTLFSGTAAHAQSVDGEWQSALYSGSSRLLLFSLLKEQPKGSLNFAQELLRRNGLDSDAQEGFQKISFQGRVTPVLEWDGNINGGTPGDSFFLGNFEFIVDDDSRALAGVLLGFGSDISSRYSLGDGHLMDFSLRTSFGYSPEHDISKVAGQASVCGNFFVENWTWLDACGRLKYAENDTSSVTDRIVGVGATKVFSSGFGSHDARAGIDVQFRDDYAKSIAGLNVTTVRAGLGSLALGVNVGELIEDKNTLLYGASASIARPIFGEVGSFAVTWSRLGGSQFFGELREDDLLSLRVTRTIKDNLSGTIGFVRRESTIALYEEQSITVGINFGGLTF